MSNRKKWRWRNEFDNIENGEIVSKFVNSSNKTKKEKKQKKNSLSEHRRKSNSFRFKNKYESD